MPETETESIEPQKRHPAPDGYVFEGLLGSGSVGTVYRAKAPDGSPCAVKIMEETPFYDDSLLSDIVEGALATRKVSDGAHIVKVLKAGKCGGRLHYIAMDLVDGGTLEELISADSLDYNGKMEIASDLSRTMAAVADAGIIHGDLKPSNILMSADGKPYVGDFYLSLYNARVQNRQNLKALPLGTPRYMSPEQAAGHLITTASDQYSLGVIFYEMFSGISPYGKEDASNILAMVSLVEAGNIAPLGSVGHGIPRRLEETVMKMLRKHHAERFRDMHEVVSALEACRNHRGGGVSENPIVKLLKSLFGGR